MEYFKITFQPGAVEVMVPQGTSLMDGMNEAGIDCDFSCGGMGKCGKCRVRILKGASGATTDERKLLTKEEIESGVRLACSVKVSDDCTVELLFERNGHKILLEGQDMKIKLEPHVSKTCVEVDNPSVKDPRSDWQRLKDAYSGGQDLEVPLKIIKGLPELLRDANHLVTAVSFEDEIIGMEKGNTAGVNLGIAFDIGTTSIVGYLMNVATGEVLATVSTLNPQTKFGGDVISRIAYAVDEEQKLEKMQSAVIGAISDLVGQAAKKAGVSGDDIYCMTVVGNTCMHHLFLGINPRYLALAPYVPAICQPMVVDAENIDIKINQAGKVLVLPNIAGYVGGDTTAVILATEMDKSRDVKLMIDIGTNCEIVLGSAERMYACSAPAGPALEGAQISSGMRGAVGAIDHIYFTKQQVEYTVIGDVKPRGICGSALLDAVAGLLELGIIDSGGRLAAGAPGQFWDRIVEQDEVPAFLLAAGEDTDHGRPIMLTQKDIRQLQLAKGAISTGISILMEKSGLEMSDIKEVLVAGAFGNYLNPHSACAIGLIPKELENKVKMIGNAAGVGAKLSLLSTGEFRRTADIIRLVDFVELASEANFTEVFAQTLNFDQRRGLGHD